MKSGARWIFAIAIALVAAGLGWWLYQRFTGQVILRVAIEERRRGDAELVGELARWLHQNGRRTRLALVTTPDETAAVEAVRTGKAELAAMRGDRALPSGLSSALALYREIAIFLALPASKIENWTQVKGKTVGVIGLTQTDDPLIRKILTARNAADAKLVHVDSDSVDAVVARGEVQLIARVRPVIVPANLESRRMRSLRFGADDPELLEIADAEALAKSDNRYEDFEIAAGALRENPPFPEEATQTLAVLRHLVIRSDTSALSVQKTLIDIMDAKRAISAEFPMARQIGSPGVEKDAAVRIHPGALSYFNGEELSLLDVALEWVYLVPMLAGGVGAGLTWLHGVLWPREERAARDMIVELLLMRREAAGARSHEELDAVEKRRDDLQDDIDETLAEGLKDRLVTALLVAADATDRKIALMRERLSRISEKTAQS